MSAIKADTGFQVVYDSQGTVEPKSKNAKKRGPSLAAQKRAATERVDKAEEARRTAEQRLEAAESRQRVMEARYARAERDRLEREKRAVSAEIGRIRRAEEATGRRNTQLFEAVVPSQVRDALPLYVREVVKEIVVDPQLNAGVNALMGREREFPTQMAALLAGIALLPESSDRFNEALDEHWAAQSLPREVDEVVIGSGLHGAIYASVRKQKGFNPPMILEANGRAGGTFAVSRAASFFMNSRNRPGQLGLPGQVGSALNVLPAAPVQPAELRGEEYLSNDVLAWAIRGALAMSGSSIATNARVEGIERSGDRYVISITDQPVLYATKVVVATGLSSPRKLTRDVSPRILSFEDLMRKMDEPFPFMGMRRVAVVGAGDSGKATIEALTGQGPSSRWSVAAVDWIDRIDWYGCPQNSRADWETCNRSRYKRIGKLLPAPGVQARVQPMPRAATINDGFDCVYVDERPYDCVIQCLGFNTGTMPFPIRGYEDIAGGLAKVGGRESGRFAYEDASLRCVLVGPAASLPLNDRETVALGAAAKLPENVTSIFRYAPRTAAIASVAAATR